MITEIRMENYKVFSKEVRLSLEADMRSRKLSSNVCTKGNFNVLKTISLYGQNNVGKSCFIKAVNTIRNVMLNKGNDIEPNIFLNNQICALGISFMYEGEKYSYDFKFDVINNEYVYEKFSKISKDMHGNEKENVYYLIDRIKEEYQCMDTSLLKIFEVISRSNILIYLIEVDKFDILSNIKEIFTTFASKIEIISMTNIPIKKTIQLLKNKSYLESKIVNLIKNADLDLDNFYYADSSHLNLIAHSKENSRPDEDVLNLPENIEDQIRLVSVHKGKPVPSLLFDSTGTKKIVALSSYIVEALEYGKILLIDELDSGLHFKITRSIVSMFNNDLNDSSQLIFTTHDINLLDCKKLLRKEQICFMAKDEEGVFIYSLGDFTAIQGVRDTTDIVERYKKGLLGALPDPMLINSLFDIKKNKDVANE